jgi:hypothetical protein
MRQRKRVAGLPPGPLEKVWRDIASKRRTSAYLHELLLLVEAVR